MVENEPDEKEAPDEAGANNPYCKRDSHVHKEE